MKALDVLGTVTCVDGTTDLATGCPLAAEGLYLAYYLENSDYADKVVEQWERHVFIANMISFNIAMGQGYEVSDGYAASDAFK